MSLVYGLKEAIKFAPIPVDGKFPKPNSTIADEIFVPNIVIGSISMEQEDGTETEVFVEDKDNPIAILEGQAPITRFVFSTHEYSDEVFKTFLGYVEKEEDGEKFYEKVPGYSIPTMFMEVITRKLDNNPSKAFQYMPCRIKVLNTMNLSKENLAQIDFEVTILANSDKITGNEISNVRIYDLA